MAFEELESIGLEKLIWTMANVGSFLCAVQGHDFPAWRFVPGETEDKQPIFLQSPEQQKANFRASAGG
jgi:hypothetical protein